MTEPFLGAPIPPEVSRFVGRGAQLAEVAALLATERLITLTGVGGGGKTRLAARVAGEWSGVVRWVELATVTDAADVPAFVAATLGVPVEPALGPVRSLVMAIGSERMLVCLDNCEHVVDGVAAVATALLGCPGVTILTTSREPLAVPGELAWPLPPLTGDEAEALFADRARAVRPGEAHDEAAVRALCVRLDGIPLAVELAAAWLRTLTPAQIEAGLDDRFALLVRGPRGAAARQRTLAASIDWSYDLLAEPERAMFRRLSVCTGGFTLDAARAVAGTPDVLGPVSRLVDTSLVVTDVEGQRVRYRMLETIREYAAARLDEHGETAATRDRHLTHVLAVAEAAEPDLDRDAWLTRLGPERDNIRAALDWGLQPLAPDPEPGRRLAAAVAALWITRGQDGVGSAYLRRALDRSPDDRTLLQARLFTGLAQLAVTAAPLDLDPAAAGYALATELGDDRLRGRCLGLSAVALFFTDAAAGWERCQEALRIAEAAGDPVGRDGALLLEGLILNLRDRHDEARPVLQKAAESLIRRGERETAATVVALQSATAMLTGDFALSQQLAERAAHLAAPLADFHRVGITRGHLARLHGMRGDVEGGLRLLEPVLATGVEVPSVAHIMGELHLWRGEPELALGWLERAAPLTGPAAEMYPTAILLPVLGAALRRAGRTDDAAATLERAVALAERRDMPGVRAAALEQQGRLLAVADPDRAADLHHDALALRVEHGLRTFYVDSLDGLAAVSDRPAEAARLIAASDRARAELGYPRTEPVPDHDDPLAAAEGAALTLDEAVALVRRTRGRRGRATSGWASLTPTELEVVRLTAEGLTNPEIGAKLLMGRGTVKTHLSHVYAKLGVANRTELATLASNR